MEASDIYEAVLGAIKPGFEAKEAQGSMRVSWDDPSPDRESRRSKTIVVKIDQAFLEDHANDTDSRVEQALEAITRWAKAKAAAFDPRSNHEQDQPPEEDIWIVGESVIQG